MDVSLPKLSHTTPLVISGYQLKTYFFKTFTFAYKTKTFPATAPDDDYILQSSRRLRRMKKTGIKLEWTPFYWLLCMYSCTQLIGQTWASLPWN